jgi:hypothetical protein
VPESVEGRNYAALIAGNPQPTDDGGALLSLPVPFGEPRKFQFAEYRGLRTEQHTYIRSIHGPWLLYDNDRDPYQMHNLCERGEYTQTRAQLDRALDRRLRALKDEFLPAAEYARPAGFGHYREFTRPTQPTRSPWGDWESTARTK